MKINLSQWYKLLIPRPAVLVSTVDKKGNSNVAPFSFVMPCSMTPPLVVFGSVPSHDTSKNIIETKNFVVNVPGDDIVNELWACADDFPPDVSEFKEAGLTEIKSEKISSPGVTECIARFECRLAANHTAGDHILFVGEIVNVSIDDKYFSGKKYLVEKARPLMHIGGPEFGLLGERIKAE